MIWIDAETIRREATYSGLCDAIAAGHTLKDGEKPAGASGRCMLTQPSPTTGGDTNFLALPSWQTGEALGIKACTGFPENAERDTGVPAVQAVYLLFDGKDGCPSAAIDGTELTYWKTAAHSATATRYLAQSDAETLVMLGAGGLGPASLPRIDRLDHQSNGSLCGTARMPKPNLWPTRWAVKPGKIAMPPSPKLTLFLPRPMPKNR